MKYIFNLAVIFLIFSLIYLPIFSSSASAASVFDAFSKWFSYYKSKNYTISSPSFNVGTISDKEINLQSGKISTKYTDLLVSVWKDASFTEENFKKLKKDKNGKVLSVEELAKYAELVGNSDDLKKSFEIWQNLDKRVVDKLKESAVSGTYANAHKSVLGWYKYHSDYAGKLAKGDLSRDQIKDLNDNYFRNAKNYLPKMQRQIAETEDPRSFAIQYLVPSVFAIAGSPQFGGLITSYTDFCISGFSFIVTGVQGGWMWIYYSVYAVNPYLYHNISPGAYIKGKSSFGSGICTKTGIDAYPSGAATVLYFGTSL